MIYILLAIIVFVPALDQLTKYLVSSGMEVGESIPVIKDILHITYIRNSGAAMGMMSDKRWIFLILSGVAVIGMTIYLFRNYRKMGRLMAISWAMIIAGGIGNMIDRTFFGDKLFTGAVIDFIDFRAISFWTYIFNIADAFVCVGVGLFILYIILDEIKEAKKKKAEKESAINSNTKEESIK